MTVPGGSTWARDEAVKRARAVLAGELDVLYGCVLLAQIADSVVPDWRLDPDFVVFGAVASESDNIPLGPAREQWKGEALARMDAMAEHYAAQVRDEVLKACNSVVARFDNRKGDMLQGSVV